MSSESVQPLLTATDLAAILKISRRTLFRLKSAGKLPRPLHVGGGVRWHPDDIRDLIDRWRKPQKG